MFLRTSTYLYIFSVLSLIVLVYVFENKVDKVTSQIKISAENIRKYKEDINILEAEWSYQNSPERLTKLFVSLNLRQDMSEAKMQQFSNLNNLPEKNILYNKTAQTGSVQTTY
ncbi:MAG TPA: hypothetical protein DIV86_01435 [Alphaproteobacteria bacterium]|nr:hypothetical protein [Alphaproteobacteria bacterium]